ncbi:unnamed protein product [Pneumocystis jirovecii]|uniref:Uncharacterized protein n=1 Tax=Pneumocystis jirovecii TaxID=42068 RepID=L0PAC5_PNEJI|nr:unnamed protein product [Pneumocystis jirovecii]
MQLLSTHLLLLTTSSLSPSLTQLAIYSSIKTCFHQDKHICNETKEILGAIIDISKKLLQKHYSSWPSTLTIKKYKINLKNSNIILEFQTLPWKFQLGGNTPILIDQMPCNTVILDNLKSNSIELKIRDEKWRIYDPFIILHSL